MAASLPAIPTRPYATRSRRDRATTLVLNLAATTPSRGELFAAYERRVRVINAHLACLKASFTASRYVAPATGETVLGIEYDPSDAYAFSGGVLAAAGDVGVVILSLSRARLEPPTM